MSNYPDGYGTNVYSVEHKLDNFVPKALSLYIHMYMIET